MIRRERRRPLTRLLILSPPIRMQKRKGKYNEREQNDILDRLDRLQELTSGAWSKKEKYEKAPNIVEFTRRFNSLGHLTRSEILNGQTPERRAQLISFFIKQAKVRPFPHSIVVDACVQKLYQMN